MSEQDTKFTEAGGREWVVKFNGSRVQITNGMTELRDWGSYRQAYPKNERQLRRGIARARKVVAEQNARQERARQLKAFAEAEGLTDAR